MYSTLCAGRKTILTNYTVEQYISRPFVRTTCRFFRLASERVTCQMSLHSPLSLPFCVAIKSAHVTLLIFNFTVQYSTSCTGCKTTLNRAHGVLFDRFISCKTPTCKTCRCCRTPLIAMGPYVVAVACTRTARAQRVQGAT